MTTQQAADRLGLTVDRVQRYCGRSGHRTIPAPTGSVGRRYIYDINEDELRIIEHAMRRAIKAARIKSNEKTIAE